MFISIHSIDIHIRDIDITTSLYLTDHILEYNIPANNKSPEFSNADVGICVGAAGSGNACAELCVAQGGQRGRDAGEKKTQCCSRSRHVSRHRPRQHVDTRPHHMSNTYRNNVPVNKTDRFSSLESFNINFILNNI